MYISRSKSTKDQYWYVVYRYFISANETKGQIRTDRIRKTTGKKKQEKQNDIVTKMSKRFIPVFILMKFLFFQKDYHGNQIYLNASSRIRIVMRKKIYRHNYHYRNLSDPTSWIKLALWSLLESEHWVSIPFGSDSEVSLKKTGCGAAQLLEILNPGAGLKWLLRAADNA